MDACHRIGHALLLGLAVLGVLLPANPAIGAIDSLAGTWTGHWARQNAKLPVVVHFARTADGYTGSFDSDQLRVIGIPFQDVSNTSTRVTWKLRGDATTAEFDGVIHDGRLEGTFREGATSGTFSLERWISPPTEPRQEQVRFQNGPVSLAGTILLPRSPGPHPGIVFLHGSGAEGRWASRFLATRFAERGVAALIFDKRGVGESKGDWRTARFEDLAGDDSAAVATLRAHSEVDPKRVGIHGHSQGGTIAPLVASKIPDLAFLVASAGAGLPMDEVEIYSLQNSIRSDSLSAEDRALADRYVKAVVATAYHGAPRERLMAIYEQVRTKPWAFPLPPATNPYWEFSRSIASFDPVAYWEKVRAPALLVYGERDRRVPGRESAKRIEEHFHATAARTLTVKFFEGADHTFRIPPRSPDGWPESAAGYPAFVIDWVVATVGRR